MKLDIGSIILLCCILFGYACKPDSHQQQLMQFSEYDLWMGDKGVIIRYVDDEPYLFHRNIIPPCGTLKRYAYSRLRQKYERPIQN